MTILYLIQRKTTTSCLFLLACLAWVTVAYGGSHPSMDGVKNASVVNCQAAFESQAYDGSTPAVGGITFYNFSEGAYDGISWDFGDGNFSSSSAGIVDHFYANSGTYQVSLTIWNSDQTCFDVYYKDISVLVSNDVCDLSPCVYPGDANADGKADLYDLIHLGMGFGATGPERPDADPMSWTPQPGPDWDMTTGDGINYKHLDGNGDGVISYQDMMPMLTHYSSMIETESNTENDGPRVYLDFDVDTIVVNEYTEDLVSISAGLVLGNIDKPFDDLYGLALYLDYDTTLTDVSTGVLVNYNEDCFMGDLNDMLPYGNDQRHDQQVDIAMSRIGGSAASGFGRVATVDFTIIIDIIDGRTERTVPFNVPIKGIKAIDQFGNLIDVNIDQQAAEVIFIKEEMTTGVGVNSLDHQVRIYPNPVNNGLVTIDLQDLTGQAIHCYNSLGQVMKSIEMSGSQLQLPVADLPKGVYHLHIQTDRGLVNKRLLVE